MGSHRPPACPCCPPELPRPCFTHGATSRPFPRAVHLLRRTRLPAAQAPRVPQSLCPCTPPFPVPHAPLPPGSHPAPSCSALSHNTNPRHSSTDSWHPACTKPPGNPLSQSPCSSQAPTPIPSVPRPPHSPFPALPASPHFRISASRARRSSLGRPAPPLPAAPGPGQALGRRGSGRGNSWRRVRTRAEPEGGRDDTCAGVSGDGRAAPPALPRESWDGGISGGD